MKHLIFYSWQSDLDPALTRNFIEDALAKAVKNLNRGDDVFVEAVVDRDTSGIAGTPGIAETIFQKIDQCDVFIGDVSIINGSWDEALRPSLFTRLVRVTAQVILEHTFTYRRIERPTPNPNVLLELGYAAARIGWERVILVQNTAYGELGGLPFDLRSRRIVPYNLAIKESRQDERPKLRDQLESALKKALAEMLAPTFWTGRSRPRWFGFWHTDGRPTTSNTLFIREVSASGFIFHLSLIDGARAGSVGGFAKFSGPDTAYARIDGMDRIEPCEIKFRRVLGEKRQIQVEESLGCRSFKGMGASFGGEYICEADLLFDSGALDELDLQRLYGITGKFYRALIDRFQGIAISKSDDAFPAKVITGGAKGLYRSFAAIVMKGGNGQLWAAYMEGGVVRYFTTEREFKEQLPQTIEHWRQGLDSSTIVYENEIDVIPRI